MLHKFALIFLAGAFVAGGILHWFSYDPPKIVNSAPGRSISTTGSNNTYTISQWRFSSVSYTINFSATLTLGTSNGMVNLDYSLDGGTTWTTVSSVSQVFGVSITITTNQNLVLFGIIPPNALVRINRANNSGVTITIGSEEETLL